MSCNVVKPLPTNLKVKLEGPGPEKNKISIYQGNKNIVSKTDLISEQTGSRSFVYRITCKGLKGEFQLVAKVQNPKAKWERLEGLKYEKMVYSLMTKIVDSGVCPFRLRSYDKIDQPKHILITETFDNMVDLSKFLNEFKNNKDHESDCYNLLIQILYAIEVNYRIGIRHNDLHAHNVMILFCDTGHKKLTYLSRNKDKKTTILMHNCRFIVKFFDNDRVTKLSAKNGNINDTYHNNYDPKPVLDLFPWHQPSVYTEKLDLFKIMQHIRDDTKSIILKNLVKSLNVSLSESEKYEISKFHGQNNFLRYHLVTAKSKRQEPLAARCSRTKSSDACTTKNIRTSSTFPKWLDNMNSSEKALMMIANLTKRFGSRVKGKTYTEVGDISKLYVKRYL